MHPKLSAFNTMLFDESVNRVVSYIYTWIEAIMLYYIIFIMIIF